MSFSKLHGTTSRYSRGCRCDDCKKAVAEYQRNLRGTRWDKATPAHAHGTVNGYKNYSCRCDLCKAAVAEVSRRERAERKALFDSVMARRAEATK